jgi:hypothetical protein
MAQHHTIPKFHLKRWANAAGRIEVVDFETLTVSEEDPKKFFALPDFNRIEAADGSADPWLEYEFLGRLDSDAANLMRQLENIPRPRSHLRQAKNRGWHPTHLLGPKASVRLAMYVGAQAVRSPAWRDAVKQHTAVDMRRFVEEKVEQELATTTDPARIEELKKMQGLRYLVSEISGNQVPHLSGHLAYRLGEVLYQEYVWSVTTIPEAALMLGDDPVLILNRSDPKLCGSYSQVAGAKGFALSLYKDQREMADAAVDVMRNNDLVLLPLDPTRMLVMSSINALILPGRHDAGPASAAGFNLLTRAASRRWVCLPPGHLEAARAAIYKKHPWRQKLDEKSVAA